MAAEERPLRKNLILVIQFLFGRLIGYMLFGLLFGYLGEKLNSALLRLAGDAALMILSLLLILYVTGVLRAGTQPASCTRAKGPGYHPSIMGFLMGIKLCPPLLLSLAYVFSLGNAAMSALYFFLFFLASSVYFLPLLAAGFLGKMKEFRLAARLSGLLVGVIFLIYSMRTIFNYLTVWSGNS
jgi:sulfite exporter TauE/SafE